MDNTARSRYELHNYVTNWISNLMNQNDIPATMMEDALTDILLRVKEASFQEYVSEVAKEFQEKEAEKTQEEDSVKEDSEEE